MSKKGQAAMEFLMTYGWAILAVLAAISALAYFGVLRPMQFSPEECVLASSSGITCMDFTISSGEVDVILSNSGISDITITRITVGSCSNEFNETISNLAEQKRFTLTGCSNGETGMLTKKDVTIEYINTISGFSKNVQGTISAKIR